VGLVAAREGGNVLRALLLAPLTALLVYALALRSLGSRLAVLAGALWVLAPWLALALFDFRVDPLLEHGVTPEALWLSGWRAPGWALVLLALALLALRAPRLGGIAFVAVLALALAEAAGGSHALGGLSDQYRGLQEYFWTAPLFLWLPVAGVIAAARRSLWAAAVVGLWAFAFLLVAGTNQHLAFADATILHALVPAFPALVVLAAALPLLVPRRR
jgi:hypothetical protein